ncbi:uncharacterized protein PG986_010771 [Apiospora aurea]|uniref:F-box domain-containing protein n=1 Tax=Apiospora aurea TaxID=335848 RepID=A0ABR1Q3C0_9PEZI
MDRLPPEILGGILHLVCHISDEKERCSYATVSQNWQAFVERATFPTLYLNQSRLGEAQAKGIITPARQSYVRCIKFTAIVPGKYYTENPGMTSQRSNEAVFEAVAKLLGAVKTWSSPPCGVELALEVDYEATPKLPDLEDGLGWDYRCSLVSLPHDAYLRLPEVSCITTVTYNPKRDTLLFLVPKTCCEIASQFPNVHTIIWLFRSKIFDRDMGTREMSPMQLRNDFATGISMLPGSVRKAFICWGSLTDDATVPTCLKETFDPLSLALREFTKQLEQLYIDAVVGNELFNDPSLNHDSEKPLWPRLRVIEISTHARTPQGYDTFDLDMCVHETDDHTEAQYRVGHLFKPGEVWCLALARAAAHMPMLEFLCIKWHINESPRLKYAVDVSSSGATFEMRSSPGLVIPDVIQNAWWKAARVHIREGEDYTSW